MYGIVLIIDTLLSLQQSPAYLQYDVCFDGRNDKGVFGKNDIGKICFVHSESIIKPDYMSTWRCNVLENAGNYFFVEPVEEIVAQRFGRMVSAGT